MLTNFSVFIVLQNFMFLFLSFVIGMFSHFLKTDDDWIGFKTPPPPSSTFPDIAPFDFFFENT